MLTDAKVRTAIPLSVSRSAIFEHLHSNYEVGRRARRLTS